MECDYPWTDRTGYWGEGREEKLSFGSGKPLYSGQSLVKWKPKNKSESFYLTNWPLKCLYSYGLAQSHFRKNMICLACDGGRVAVSRKSGVGKGCQDKPWQTNLIIGYCLLRLYELGVRVCLANANRFNNLRRLIDTIYTFFSHHKKAMMYTLWLYAQEYN